MSKVGYIRVSAIDQNTERQEVALKELNINKIFTEKLSGKNTNRPELHRMLDYVRGPVRKMRIYNAKEIFLTIPTFLTTLRYV